MTAAELRAIRVQLGWRVDDTANRLGITTRTYHYYETGIRSSGRPNPSVPRAIAVAMLAFRFVAGHFEDAAAELGAALSAEGVTPLSVDNQN